MLSHRRPGERLAGRRRRVFAAVAMTAVTAILVYGCGEASSPAPQAPPKIVIRAGAPRQRPISEQKPPRPRHLDVASQAQERSARPAPKVKFVRADPSKMPAASAGTNGSFTPPSNGRKSMNPHTMAGIGNLPASRSAILLHGVALAPPSAPDPIKRAISAANQIVGSPYVWGGGHASWRSRGYDCSGAVSYALAGGGFLSAPLSSSELESWGAPGPGKWLTVYANAGHTYAVIAGLRWDTVGDAQGSGPRWHPALPYPHGFTVRHPPGY